MSETEHIINYINVNVDLLKQRNSELSSKILKLEDRIARLENRNIDIGEFR